MVVSSSRPFHCIGRSLGASLLILSWIWSDSDSVFAIPGCFPPPAPSFSRLHYWLWYSFCMSIYPQFLRLEVFYHGLLSGNSASGVIASFFLVLFNSPVAIKLSFWPKCSRIPFYKCVGVPISSKTSRGSINSISLPGIADSCLPSHTFGRSIHHHRSIINQKTWPVHSSLYISGGVFLTRLMVSSPFWFDNSHTDTSLIEAPFHWSGHITFRDYVRLHLLLPDHC